jgi:integrase
MSRHTKGRLFKRGANFCVQYYLNGKEFKHLLRDEAGNPVKTLRLAEELKSKLMAPYTARDLGEKRKMAVAALTDAEERIVLAEDAANPPLRIKDAWASFVDSQDRPDSGGRTLADYEGYFRRFTGWCQECFPEAVYMRDITSERASDYCAWLKRQGLGPNSFNKRLSVMRLIFRVLKKAIRTLENPFESIKPQKLRQNSRRELTIDELNLVLSKAEGDLALLLGLGTFSGLRLGDCCTLKWGEVDLARRVIRRVPNKTASRSGKPVLIGIPQILYDRLADIPPAERSGWLLPSFAEKYLDLNKRSAITHQIQEHFVKCGIKTHRTGTGGNTGKRAVVDVGFHSLRHTYVSLCAGRGVPLAVIQENVGHGNAAMTRHYLHVSEDTARQVAERLSLSEGQTSEIEPERENLLNFIKNADITTVRLIIKKHCPDAAGICSK